MYKEIHLKISENVISEMKSQLITCRIVDKPLSAPEQAIFLILKSIEDGEKTITIELKKDLKKKSKKKKRKKKK